MSIAAKLNQMIELLPRIDVRLSPQSEQETPVTDSAPPTLTKSMLEFQLKVEFIGWIERTHYLMAAHLY